MREAGFEPANPLRDKLLKLAHLTSLPLSRFFQEKFKNNGLFGPVFLLWVFKNLLPEVRFMGDDDVDDDFDDDDNSSDDEEW